MLRFGRKAVPPELRRRWRGRRLVKGRDIRRYRDQIVAIHWERLAGDTSAFAIKIAFMDDPDRTHGESQDLSVSWGAFQIWVNGWNLCAHLEEGEQVESAHWYLLPLLEWFVHQWNPLLHEERLPCKAADDAWTGLRDTRFPPPALNEAEESAWESSWHGWWSRHAIQAANEGGIFPDVIFRRFQDSIEVSWGDARGHGVPDHVSFDLRPGSARLDPERVAQPLYDVLEDAAAYLSSASPDSDRIADLKQAIRRLRHLQNPGFVDGTTRQRIEAQRSQRP